MHDLLNHKLAHGPLGPPLRLVVFLTRVSAWLSASLELCTLVFKAGLAGLPLLVDQGFKEISAG